jgi:hypothetical protein
MCREWQQAAIEAAEEYKDKEARRKEVESTKKRQAKRLTNIYVMRNERNGYVKIGRSQAPFDRELTLQSEDPEICMLFYFPAPIDLECKLHNEFEEYRVRGEWFKLTPNQIENIKTKYLPEVASVGAR